MNCDVEWAPIDAEWQLSATSRTASAPLSNIGLKKNQFKFALLIQKIVNLGFNILISPP